MHRIVAAQSVRAVQPDDRFSTAARRPGRAPPGSVMISLFSMFVVRPSPGRPPLSLPGLIRQSSYIRFAMRSQPAHDDFITPRLSTAARASALHRAATSATTCLRHSLKRWRSFGITSRAKRVVL